MRLFYIFVMSIALVGAPAVLSLDALPVSLSMAYAGHGDGVLK